MKTILRLELQIRGLSQSNEVTHEYHTAGAVVNLPALPARGEWLYFNSIIGTCPISGGEVEKVEWLPDDEKVNVLIPFIWMKKQIWDEQLKIITTPIKDAVAQCKRTLALQVSCGSIQLTLID